MKDVLPSSSIPAGCDGYLAKPLAVSPGGPSLLSLWLEPGSSYPATSEDVDQLFLIWSGSVKREGNELRPGAGDLVRQGETFGCEAGPAGAQLIQFRSRSSWVASLGGEGTIESLFDLNEIEEKPFDGVGITGNALAVKIPEGEIRTGAAVVTGKPKDASIYSFRYGPGITVPRHHHDVDQVQLVLAGQMKFGSRRLLPGQGVCTRSETMYQFTTGDLGLRWIEFRPEKLWSTFYHD